MEVEVVTLLIVSLIILGANIIQGITGFAGTLIAMPFLIILIDIETARQVLNFLGILASLWIIRSDYGYIQWPQLKKIVFIMLIGLWIGMMSFNHLSHQILLLLLPLFVLFVGIKGLVRSFISSTKSPKKRESWLINLILLLLAGIFHGLFVSGGPLLVTYAAKNLKGKYEFRATLSAVWFVLNTFILLQSFTAGMITSIMISYMFLTIIPLFLGILMGGILLRNMSQKLFMLLTYVLLILSAISLLV